VLRFLDVGIQVVNVIKPRGPFVVLNDGECPILGESAELAGTHAEIHSSFFRSQQPSRDVILDAHQPLKIRHNLGTVDFGTA
jgi:hypothetical protein